MKAITSGQQEQCVTVIKDAARKGGETAIAELAANGIINIDNFQRVLGLGNKLAPMIQTFVKEKIAELVEHIAGCCKLISGAETLELAPTDGKQMIAKARQLFDSWLDSDFKDWDLDVKSEPTEKQKVQVHEMIKNGTFEQIFNGLGDNLDQLCLTQPQIIQFVEKHRKWLRADGYGTFFLFKVAKGEGSEFFVARVLVKSAGLRVYACRFSYDGVWGAECRRRVVVPQLALAN